MSFYVYLILSHKNNKYTTYVGYTSNIVNRIKLHNTSKGAKFTKGRKWKLIFKKKYLNKANIIDLLKVIIPEFNHIETGKSLDQKM